MENLSLPTASLTCAKENLRGYSGRRSKIAAHATKAAAEPKTTEMPALRIAAFLVEVRPLSIKNVPTTSGSYFEASSLLQLSRIPHNQQISIF